MESFPELRKRIAYLSFIILAMVFIPCSEGAPLPNVDFTEASSGLNTFLTEIGRSTVITWSTTESVIQNVIKLSKYIPEDGVDNVMFIKTGGQHDAEPEGLDERDQSRFSLVATEETVEFRISVVNPLDEGVYTLTIIRPDTTPAVAVASIQVGGTFVTAAPSEDSDVKDDDSQTETSTSPISHGLVVVIAILGLIILVGIIVIIVLIKRGVLKLGKTENRQNGDVPDGCMGEEMVPLANTRTLKDEDLKVYTMADDNRGPVEVQVSRESAETVANQYKEWTLGTWVKQCRQVVIETTDNRNNLIQALGQFAAECGIHSSDSNTDPASIEYSTLRRCFDRDPCHGLVVELPFQSLMVSYCKQAFILVKVKSNAESTGVTLDLSFVEMSLNTPMTDNEEYEATDSVNVEGFAMGFNLPESVLSQVSEQEKQNYFRYEAIRRMHHEAEFSA